MVNLLPQPRDPGEQSAPLSPALVERIRERLLEVRAWSATRAASMPIASRLRSADFMPDLEETIGLAPLQEVLHELTGRRRAALAAHTATTTMPTEGRLLICELDMSIGDGRSEAASGGFFDQDDRPPWDLWLDCYARARSDRPDEPLVCLITWVPSLLEDTARAGIEANRCRCVYWADDAAPGLATQLVSLIASGPEDDSQAGPRSQRSPSTAPCSTSE